MKHIGIVLRRKEYTPGDRMKGRVVLNCDEPVKCKRAYIAITGQMMQVYVETTVKGKGRLSSKTKLRTWSLYSATSNFAEDMCFDPGKHEFPFQFQLPDDLKPSYNGQDVRIVYGIIVHMDISQKKLSANKNFHILQPIEELPDEVFVEANSESRDKHLMIKMDSQKYCIGNDIAFSYLVNTDMRFESLRASIEHIEHFDKWMTRFLLKKKIPSEDVKRHEWTKVVLRTSDKFPVSFSFDKLQSSLNLKVTIDRRLKSDITARIPLIAGHCLKAGWREEKETGKRRPSVGKIPTSIAESDKESAFQYWYNRAITFRDKGDIAKAIRSIDTAIKWQPDSAEALALRDELNKHEE